MAPVSFNLYSQKRLYAFALVLSTLAFSGKSHAEEASERHLGLEATFTPLETLDSEIARNQNYLHGVDLIKNSFGKPYSVEEVPIAIWDNGGILTTHESFGGRVIDAQSFLPSPHATIAAGIIGSGPLAIIPYGNQVVGVSDFEIVGYSYCPHKTAHETVPDQMRVVFQGADEDDESVPPVKVANHSWGFPHCWPNEFQKAEVTRAFDELIFSHPEVVAVVAAGNEGKNGSESVCPRRNDAPKDHYPLLGTIRAPGDAKNVITVGNMMPTDQRLPEVFATVDGVIQTFEESSNGPAPGGRIKPDVLALGQKIIGPYSDPKQTCKVGPVIIAPDDCAEVTDQNHKSCIREVTGTSFSTPFTTGTIGILEAVSHSKRGLGLRADEAKALLIHSALSADNRPTYSQGWGPFRADYAASVVEWWNAEDFLPDKRGNVFTRLTLGPGETRVIHVKKRPGFPVRVTASWLDMPAEKTAALDGIDLVNDLDISLVPETGSTGESYLPWKLDPRPDHRDTPATRGINTRDNVERIDVRGDVNLVGPYKLIFDASKITDVAIDVAVISSGLLERDQKK